MKTILQHDQRDCGAASLAMIADHYGYSHSLEHFRELTATGPDGTSVFNIAQAAKKIGLRAAPLQGDVQDLKKEIAQRTIHFPCIAHIITEDNYSHFVVITAITRDNVHVLDPAKGKLRVKSESFFSQWTGVIILFSPEAAFSKHKKATGNLLPFFKLLKGQTRRVAAILLISAIIAGIGIMGAFVFQLVIDHSSEIIASPVASAVHEHHNHEIEYLSDNLFLGRILEAVTDFFSHITLRRLNILFAAMIGLYGLTAAIQYLKGRLIISMSKALDLSLTLPYFNHILDLPLSSALRRKTGDYLSRYADTAAIRNAVSTAALTLILDSLMAIGCGWILFLQSRRLFLIAGVMIALYAFMMLFNKKRITDSNRIFMEKNAHVQAFMKESIDGLETVKALNSTGDIKKTMLAKFNTFLNAAVKKSRIVIAQDSLATGIEMIGISVVLWQGFSLVAQGSISLGTLITFYVLLGYFITPVKNLIDVQPTMRTAVVAAERLSDIMQVPAERCGGKDITAVNPIQTWEVSDLSFRYANNEALLNKISFTFHAGERIALIGKSGSGKTTLAKLFVRFYEPESGSICADGVPINQYSLESLRKTVLYVSNHSTLFSGSIYEALQAGDERLTEEEIKSMCKATHLEELIESLPGGYNFIIEEGGVNLSGGQKQRIAITRALLKKPRVLILDEATANLDKASQKQILKAISDICPETALLMITHQTDALEKFDTVLKMENGSIVRNSANDTVL